MIQPQFFNQFFLMIVAWGYKRSQVDSDLCVSPSEPGVWLGLNSRFSPQRPYASSNQAETFFIISGLSMRSFWHPGTLETGNFYPCQSCFSDFLENGVLQGEGAGGEFFWGKIFFFCLNNTPNIYIQLPQKFQPNCRRFKICQIRAFSRGMHRITQYWLGWPLTGIMK